MTRILLGVGAAILGLVVWVPSADAARCRLGQVYRPSIGVCQSKQVAARQGVYWPRAKKRVKKVHRRSVRHVVRVPRKVGGSLAPLPDRIPSGSANPAVWFHYHLQDWVDRNRQMLIRHGEGL